MADFPTLATCRSCGNDIWRDADGVWHHCHAEMRHPAFPKEPTDPLPDTSNADSPLMEDAMMKEIRQIRDRAPEECIVNPDTGGYSVRFDGVTIRHLTPNQALGVLRAINVALDLRKR
jgi:hypothetical protein